MRCVSTKLFALLLVGVMYAVSGAALTMPVSKMPSPPAGCHGHSKPAPIPAPVDYFCCQVGHSPALQQDTFRLTAPLLAAIFAQISEFQPALPVQITLVIADNQSSSPPGLVPLRI